MALTYETDGHICTITLNRPKALNAFNQEMAAEFSQACARFRDDPTLRVAIVTGAGDRAFSAGADLKELVPSLTNDPAKGGYTMPPTIMRGQIVYKPFIAAVNGLCLGGGLECALACDLRIASRTATFGQPEVGLGLVPGWGGTQRLPRLLSGAWAAEILLTGRTLDADTALRVGLVNAVVEPEALLPTARDYAERIGRNAPLAVQASKEAALRGVQMPLEDGLRLESLIFDRLTYTNDVQEGLQAFAERRPTQFSGT